MSRMPTPQNQYTKKRNQPNPWQAWSRWLDGNTGRSMAMPQGEDIYEPPQPATPPGDIDWYRPMGQIQPPQFPAQPLPYQEQQPAAVGQPPAGMPDIMQQVSGPPGWVWEFGGPDPADFLGVTATPPFIAWQQAYRNYLGGVNPTWDVEQAARALFEGTWQPPAPPEPPPVPVGPPDYNQFTSMADFALAYEAWINQGNAPDSDYWAQAEAYFQSLQPPEPPPPEPVPMPNWETFADYDTWYTAYQQWLVDTGGAEDVGVMQQATDYFTEEPPPTAPLYGDFDTFGEWYAAAAEYWDANTLENNRDAAWDYYKELLPKPGPEFADYDAWWAAVQDFMEGVPSGGVDWGLSYQKGMAYLHYNPNTPDFTNTMYGSYEEWLVDYNQYMTDTLQDPNAAIKAEAFYYFNPNAPDYLNSMYTTYDDWYAAYVEWATNAGQTIDNALLAEAQEYFTEEDTPWDLPENWQPDWDINRDILPTMDQWARFQEMNPAAAQAIMDALYAEQWYTYDPEAIFDEFSQFVLDPMTQHWANYTWPVAQEYFASTGTVYGGERESAFIEQMSDYQLNQLYPYYYEMLNQGRELEAQALRDLYDRQQWGAEQLTNITSLPAEIGLTFAQTDEIYAGMHLDRFQAGLDAAEVFAGVNLATANIATIWNALQQSIDEWDLNMDRKAIENILLWAQLPGMEQSVMSQQIQNMRNMIINSGLLIEFGEVIEGDPLEYLLSMDWNDFSTMLGDTEYGQNPFEFGMDLFGISTYDTIVNQRNMDWKGAGDAFGNWLMLALMNQD